MFNEKLLYSNTLFFDLQDEGEQQEEHSLRSV